MRERGGMNKITISTEAGLRLEIDGAHGVSAGANRRVVVQAAERDIKVDLPPTAAVRYLTEEEEIPRE